MGLIYLKAKKPEEAIKALRKAVKINPKIAAVIRQIPKLGLAELPDDVLRKIGVV